jgi:hypothetical protein
MVGQRHKESPQMTGHKNKHETTHGNEEETFYHGGSPSAGFV